MHQGHEPLLKKLADDLVSKGQALNNDRSSFVVRRSTSKGLRTQVPGLTPVLRYHRSF